MLKVKAHLTNLYRVKLEEGRKKYLHLDMNEGAPGLPNSFLKKAFAGINQELLSTYPEYKPLQKKIAKHNHIQPENICLANGSDAAIKYIFDAYVSKGDKVLMTNPTFAMYPVYCEMFRARPVIIDYRQDLSFPFEGFMKHISRQVKIAVVVNPNNPTGSILEENKLIQIIKKAAKNNVLIIVDEAYFYFYPHSLMKFIKKYKNLIVLRTFSKALGMAGGRLGYAAADPEIIENLRRVKPTFGVNGFAVLLAERLLDNSAVIRKIIREEKEGKEYLVRRLTGEGIGHRKGHANFVLIRCNGRVGRIIKELRRKRILVNGNFRQGFLRDYIRVTTANKKIMHKFWINFIRAFRCGRLKKI